MKPKPDRQARRRAVILDRAASETFRARPVVVSSEESEKPFIIRALYGPVNGLSSSRILVLRFREDYARRRKDMTREERDTAHGIDAADIVVSREDFPVHGLTWGPREFLQNLLECIAAVGGHAIIVMLHSGQQVEVDAEAFKTWAERSQRDPVTALLEPAQLLLGG